MYRTAMGEPRPKGHLEIEEAIDDVGIDPTRAWAEFDYQTPGDGMAFFDGWSAEVHGENEDGEDVDFSTGGYESKDELVKDLVAARIPRKEIRDR